MQQPHSEVVDRAGIAEVTLHYKNYDSIERQYAAVDTTVDEYCRTLEVPRSASVLTQ